MAVDLSIRISGQAGQGMQTMGSVVAAMIKQQGLHIFAYQDNMSRIRGGENFFELRASDRVVAAPGTGISLLVPLNKESFLSHRASVSANGRVALDREKYGINEPDDKIIDVPFSHIVNEVGGNEQLISAVGAGVIAGCLGIPFAAVEQRLRAVFVDKGDQVMAQNIACALKGHQIGSENIFLRTSETTYPDDKGLLLSGNDAIALGAIGAGCRFYSAYPMSPSTTIMETMGHFASGYRMVVEQAEDEIAAINMVIGASFAGVRAMTGTSGGGFALMTEGVSLAAMTETPVVIALAQRPAPATGFPTRTEQADLELAIHAGHGEFARVIYSPGTQEEAFALTVKAFDVAERYQIPAIILTDQFLADSLKDVPALDMSELPKTRHVLARDESGTGPYARYALTPSGISPRAIPSWIDDVMYVGSDEHDEFGHITEDGEIRKRMVDKRLRLKMQALTEESIEPLALGIESAKIVLIGFGSTCGVLGEVMENLRGAGIGTLHFSQVWPLPARTLSTLSARSPGCRLFTVENNATGQLARLIRRETGILVSGSVLKYDGRPFTLEEILDQVKTFIKEAP
ncbi:MAG: 2-oxoacid:acceptor oxidoreductase subunit alpha [Chitinispirillaceae bacterium]|jgi:2-oxoglutarate ferredoxin oxidoreductase subunit alpha|nr:2-oxoacid:acceptor oxidoreductase subunit alpha [Chitinispirillaceae bacterium]